MGFFLLLFLAHLQAVLVPIFLGIKSRKRFRQISFPFLISFAFSFLGIASMFEMIDHTTTDFIYIDHVSMFNWLFYSFLAAGLSLFSISVSKKKSIILLNLLLILSTIVSYWLFGKSTSLLFQVIISILLILEWWKRFKDWLLFIYPISGVLMTTVFGFILSNSGDQVWHVFIGPSGTVSSLALYFVLNRSRRKELPIYER